MMVQIFSGIWYFFIFYSNGTQSRYKWIFISLNISAVNHTCTFIFLFHISVFFTSIKISLFKVITRSQKTTWWRKDVSHLEVVHNAHYVTGEHVTPPATYKYLQSVRCSTDTQNTKHDLHIATDFVSHPCGSNRILLAGFSVL